MRDLVRAKLAEWRYQQLDKRDLRLDWLRGFAIFAMAINHIQTISIYQSITGNGRFLTGAPEAFFFISGYTLGLVSEARATQTAIRRLAKRTWEIYLAAISVALGLAGLSLLTELPLDSIDIATFGELRIWVIEFLTLQRDFFYSNILILYVIYLAVGVLVVWALKKDLAWLVIVGIALVYWASQVFPEATGLPFASFRHLAGNSPIFFGAVVIGFNSRNLENWWNDFKFSQLLDWACVVICVALIVGFSRGFQSFPIAGEWLRDYRPLSRSINMPWQNLLISFIFFRFYFIVLTNFWGILHGLIGWFIMPLGRRSLMAFIFHLVLIPLFAAAPGYENIREIWLGTIWVTVFLGILYGLVRGYDHLRSLGPAKSERGVRFFDRLGIVLALGMFVFFISAAALEILPDHLWH